MKRLFVLALLITACGNQSEQEFYLEDFMRDNPTARFRTVDTDENICWTIDGEPDTYISLQPNLSRAEVYTLAMECMNLGKAAEK